ncbi:MAG: hypothetical protein IT285_05155 [Bdellovibrionales bacterium]|nr:hypothetical protein [Bdellovibrionales bacterium]
MNAFKIASFGRALGLLAGLAMLGTSARAELVFDGEAAAAAPAAAAPQAAGEVTEERSALRSVLETSERAQTPDTYGAAQAPAVENMTKAELLRRERMRKELQNEDLLQTRLEELRLRDEARRSQELLGGAPVGGQPAAAPAPAAAPVETQVIGDAATPVATDMVVTSQAQAAAPAAGQPAAAPAVLVATVGPAEVGGYAEDEEETTRISIMPRGGFADMTSSEYDLQGRFSAGVGAGVEVSDNLTFELGYAYSEFGVGMQSTDFQVYMLQQYDRNPEPVVLKQNVIDAGLKMSLLGRDSKLRPFLGGGAAYSMSFVNYDDRYLQYKKAMGETAQDYEVSSFLGYLSTGFDLRLSKSISVGAIFKYYAVLTSRENQSLNNMGAFYGYNPYAYPYGGTMAYGQDADKQGVSGSLARSNFYSVLAGLSFTF